MRLTPIGRGPLAVVWATKPLVGTIHMHYCSSAASGFSFDFDLDMLVSRIGDDI
jgi:hypothetical protein